MNSKEHLLVCLSEEANEVAKDCSKALRFGIDDVNILYPSGPTNRQRLIDELNDFMAVVCLLIQNGTLPDNWLSEEKTEAKIKKIKKFLNYAQEVGTLQ